MEQVLGILIGNVIGVGIAFLLLRGSIGRTIDDAVKKGFDAANNKGESK